MVGSIEAPSLLFKAAMVKWKSYKSGNHQAIIFHVRLAFTAQYDDDRSL